MTIREINPTEYPLMQDFLYNAIFIPPGEALPDRKTIFEPEVYIYIDNFGSQRGDIGVVAKQDGSILGMAWTRIIPAFGHIDNDTPELATSVLPEYRGRGVGTKLMKHLFELLKEQGFTKTSLAVQKANDAVRFYKRLGYETVNENEEEYIMLKRLGGAPQ